MKRIFTSMAIVLAILNTHQAYAQCSAPNVGTCSETIETFATDPIAKNYLLSGFMWPGTETSAQSLRIPSAAPNSDYLITTPAFYLTNGGVVNVGFVLSTSTGSNNYFQAGTLDLTIEILNAANDQVIASCAGNLISAAGRTCFQISSANIIAGTMIRYRFIFVTSSGVNGTRILNFDDLAVGASQQAVLPVTFMSISGAKVTLGNKVTWTVGTETNVDRYEIERSSNGKSYSVIGTVPATRVSSYDFTDTNPGTSTNYYRVKSKDYDEFTKISPVLTMKSTTTKGGKGKIALGAYPTPTTSELYVQHDPATVMSVLNIVSIDGRVVKNIMPAKGSIQTTVNMSGLQPGVYFIRHQGEDGEVETIKIIKQ